LTIQADAAPAVPIVTLVLGRLVTPALNQKQGIRARHGTAACPTDRRRVEQGRHRDALEGALPETPADDLRVGLEVNVISLARIRHRPVPPMLARRWGRVIDVTSGIRAEPSLTARAISRAAVGKLARDFAPSVAGSGVQMNQLDSGWPLTDLGGPQAPSDPSSVAPEEARLG
jgi:NAD(P)-dependent dehydrogenase (short-subunit alcohol dehydrogenase family)